MNEQHDDFGTFVLLVAAACAALAFVLAALGGGA